MNSTWIFTSDLASQRALKAIFYSLVWYILMLVIRLTKTPDPRISWPCVYMMETSTQNESKASLRLRLFCMMKHMHQYKQKKKEKDEYFGFVAKINFFLVSLI